MVASLPGNSTKQIGAENHRENSTLVLLEVGLTQNFKGDAKDGYIDGDAESHPEIPWWIKRNTPFIGDFIDKIGKERTALKEPDAGLCDT